MKSTSNSLFKTMVFSYENGGGGGIEPHNDTTVISDMRKTLSRHKLDFSSADSYIPVALVSVKMCFYTTMIPFLSLMSPDYTIMIISLYSIVLYVDHIYLVFSKNHFIDSTAICLDILASNVFSLVWPSNDSSWTTVSFILWGVCGAIYIATTNTIKTIPIENHRFYLHIVTFIIFVSLLFSTYDITKRQVFNNNNNNSTVTPLFFEDNDKSLNLYSVHFLVRNFCYTLLVLIDSYTFRPPTEQDTERKFICKYGSVLFSPWYLSIFLTLFLSLTQFLKVFQFIDLVFENDYEDEVESNTKTSANNNNGNDSGGSLQLLHKEILSNADHAHTDECDVSKLDVMEAFRMAKQQYTNKNNSNMPIPYHGGKIN